MAAYLIKCLLIYTYDFHIPYSIEPIADPEVLLKGGEEFTFGDTTVKCIHSPGHSEGSMVYYVTRGSETLMVTGDVLFENSIGRTEWESRVGSNA